MLSPLHLFGYTDPAQLLVKAAYYQDDLHHDLPNVGNTSTTVKYCKLHFNIRYDTLSRSNTRQFASKIAKRDDSVEHDFLHCPVERPRGDMVNLDHHLHLERQYNSSEVYKFKVRNEHSLLLRCYTIWHSKCKSGASIVLPQKFIQGRAATVFVPIFVNYYFTTPYFIDIEYTVKARQQETPTTYLEWASDY